MIDAKLTLGEAESLTGIAADNAYDLIGDVIDLKETHKNKAGAYFNPNPGDTQKLRIQVIVSTALSADTNPATLTIALMRDELATLVNGTVIQSETYSVAAAAGAVAVGTKILDAVVEISKGVQSAQANVENFLGVAIKTDVALDAGAVNIYLVPLAESNDAN